MAAVVLPATGLIVPASALRFVVMRLTNRTGGYVADVRWESKAGPHAGQFVSEFGQSVFHPTFPEAGDGWADAVAEFAEMNRDSLAVAGDWLAVYLVEEHDLTRRLADTVRTGGIPHREPLDPISLLHLGFPYRVAFSVEQVPAGRVPWLGTTWAADVRAA